MSDLAKKIFEENREEFFEGNSTLEELLASNDIEDDIINAYVLILNQKSPEYDFKLDALETDHGMTSLGFTFTHAGFIEGDGEASRIGIFGSRSKESGSDIGTSQEKMAKFLGDVLFDIYQLK